MRSSEFKRVPSRSERYKVGTTIPPFATSFLLYYLLSPLAITFTQALFWGLLALYISTYQFGTPWAVEYGQKEVETVRNQAQDVLAWYDNMKNPIPTWYLGNQQETGGSG